MRKELEERLFDRWPAWFNLKGDPRQTRMADGFCLQVKQKLGGLRFYVNHRTDAICERIAAAELESIRTCEVCGKPGKRREGNWIRTLCEEHARIRAK